MKRNSNKIQYIESYCLHQNQMYTLWKQISPLNIYINAENMYHQQQNKWNHQRYLTIYLPISKLHSILALPNLLAHNNITISYYGQVNSLWLKSSVASKWARKDIWGYHLFSCLWYINVNYYYI